jgi:beta-lactamase class A
MSKNNHKLKIVILVVVAFLAGTFATQAVQYTTKQQKYSLLAKRVQIDNPNDQIVNFINLRNELESYATSLEIEPEIDSVSIYFEYLPTGVSVSVNDDNESIGASLVKVPFVMTLYKLAQDGKIDLDAKVSLKKEMLNSDYGTLYQKGAGYEITLREAAKLTLKDSDNTAVLLIANQIDKVNKNDGGANQVFNYLDMEFSVDDEERVIIGPRSYSSIMKCLYVACYNSKEHAQEILTYLAESSFDNRLTSLLPEDIKVAHKIGTFSNEYQSDCGIVYVPERNYVLCVMVKGDDPAASRTIAVISKKVHSFVNEASNSFN